MTQPRWHPWVGFAPRFFSVLRQGFAADLGGAVEASLLEIIGGIASHFIQDVRQHVRSERGKALAVTGCFFRPSMKRLLRPGTLPGPWLPHRHAGWRRAR